MSAPRSEVGASRWRRLGGQRTKDVEATTGTTAPALAERTDDGERSEDARTRRIPKVRLSSPAFLADERWRRRLLWIGLLLVCFILPLLSQSGKYVADTKLPLWFATPRYLASSLHVWQSSPYLGNEQHDGILFPMGLVVETLRLPGLPIWLVERLWHGLLLFAAAGGMVVLVDTLTDKKLTLAQPIAAAAFAFNPYSLGFGLHGSAVFVPYALLPLLLVAWVRGLRQPTGWFWPAAVALVFFGMGGGNGAPQVYTLVPLLAYLAWAVFVERSIPGRTALLFTARAGVLAIAVNLYWLVGLTTQGVTNDIAFSEQPAVINVTSSFSESLRLLGFWGFYGVDRFGPWYPSMQRFLLSPVLILGSFVLPLVAVVGAWRSRWKLRSFFALLVVLGVVVMAGIYPVHGSTPFGRTLNAAYGSVPGFSGLRTTYKFASTLALALSLLAGIGAVAIWRWMRERAVLRRLGPLVVAFLMLGLVANAYPLWSANLYPGFRTVKAVPTYWTEAVASLERSVGDGRAFFAPGGLFVYYPWGGPGGSVAEMNPQLASIRRPALPIMQRYGSDLLAAIEQPYQLGPWTPGATAVLLRRLGAHFVVLQNDINFARTGTARPSDMQILFREPGLERESFFGRSGENVPGAGPLSSRDKLVAAFEHTLPPVQVLSVADPVPILRAEGGPPLVVSGDAFGLPPILASGLLGRDQPFLYSGNLTPSQLGAIAPDDPAFVITDSNRRRDWTFAAVRENYGYTLTAKDGRASLGYNLFGGKLDTQSVTQFHGASDITASAYGSPFVQQPWFRPALAFDGNPATAWTVNDFTPVGEWVRIDFDHPIALSQLTIDPYVGQPGTRSLSSVAIDFSNGTTVTARIGPGVTTPVAFSQRSVDWLRIRLAGVRPGVFAGPVGIRDVTIPDLTVQEAVRVPTDLIDTAEGTAAGRSLMSIAPLAYVFDRAGGGRTPDEERGLDRIFRVPPDRLFDLSGTVRLDPQVPDQELDRLLVGKTDVVASSSGRAANNPGNRASLAIDGNPDTGWTGNGTRGQWIQVDFPSHRIDGFTIQGFVDDRHSPLSEVRIDLSDGTSFLRGVPSDGRLKVAISPRELSSIRITVEGAGIPAVLGGGARPPAGIAELTIPGVRSPAPPDELEPLRCYKGPGLLVDGRETAVRLGGTPRRLLTGQTLGIETCNRKPISLTGGDHEIAISGVFQPTTVALASPGATGAPLPSSGSPTLAVHQTISGYRIDVKGATSPYYLVLGQNVSPAWVASAAGRSLGPPLVIDGYSAGWRVDRTGDYTITVSYAAQSRQNLGYLISAIALPVVLIMLVIGWRKRRKRRRA